MCIEDPAANELDKSVAPKVVSTGKNRPVASIPAAIVLELTAAVLTSPLKIIS